MVSLPNLDIRDGLLRMSARALRGAPRRAAQIEELLVRQPGVTAVKTNTLTGSVQVTFNSTATHYDEILRALSYLGCPIELGK